MGRLPAELVAGPVVLVRGRTPARGAEVLRATLARPATSAGIRSPERLRARCRLRRAILRAPYPGPNLLDHAAEVERSVKAVDPVVGLAAAELAGANSGDEVSNARAAAPRAGPDDLGHNSGTDVA
jgi:hypothetical protein